MKYSVFLILIVTSFFLSKQASAQVTPYTIERSNVLNFKSKSLEKSYDVYVKLPRSYSKNPEKHYPVILLTDGRYAFPLVSSISRTLSNGGKIEEPIIIGLSYSKEESWQMSRTRDYTPTHAPNEAIYGIKEARKVSGGAKAYVNFLQNELLPFISNEYRVDQNQKIYAGHSFGGLLGGYMVKEFPSAFNSYIISDPSFWYDEGVIFDIPNTKPNNASQKANVLIVSKPRPPSEDPKTIDVYQMGNNARKFGNQLKAKPSFYSSVDVEIIDGEIHETIFPIAVSHGMLKFLRK